MSDDANGPLVLSEVAGDGVLVLTLNDPGSRNALGPDMRDSLAAEIRRFRADRSLRCLLVTGTGKSFSSGAHVKRDFADRIAEKSSAGNGAAAEPGRGAVAEPEHKGPWELLDPAYTSRQHGDFGLGPEFIRLLHNLDKPSVAAVNGYAYGVGLGLAVSCDFRVAGTSAKFCEAFIKNGIVPADGSTWQLPRLIGYSNALWLQYTGDVIDSAEALRIGLVNRVVEDADLMSTARAMAQQLASGPVFTMGLIKQLVHQGYQQDLYDNLAMASRAQLLAKASYDHKEGVHAFLEKRPPRFRGY